MQTATQTQWEPIPGSRYTDINHPRQATITLNGREGIGPQAVLEFASSEHSIPIKRSVQDFTDALASGKYVPVADREFDEATGPAAPRVIIEEEIPQLLEAIAESAAETVAAQESMVSKVFRSKNGSILEIVALDGDKYQTKTINGPGSISVNRLADMIGRGLEEIPQDDPPHPADQFIPEEGITLRELVESSADGSRVFEEHSPGSLDRLKKAEEDFRAIGFSEEKAREIAAEPKRRRKTRAEEEDPIEHVVIPRTPKEYLAEIRLHEEIIFALREEAKPMMEAELEANRLARQELTRLASEMGVAA